MAFLKKLFGSHKKEEENADDKSKNFRYFDDLIHSGVNEIVLDADIVLDKWERPKYAEGIILDVDRLVIDGNGHSIDACGKVGIFRCSGKNITIKNTTFKNGLSVGGGAIYNQDSGDLVLEACVFSNNTALNGGAIVNFGKISCRDVDFTDNLAKSEDGGAINNPGGDLVLEDCVFSGNVARRYSGAIHNHGKISCRDVDFTDNVAKEGAGGAINNPGGDLVLEDCVFSGNVARRYSGAIHNHGKISCRDVDFTDNVAKENAGGAIDNQSSGDLVFEDCVFSGNAARRTGGAIINWGKITCKEVNFTNNSSKQNGGAILNILGSFLTCRDCDFEGNVSPYGSGISNESDNARFVNCKFIKHEKSSNVINNKKDLTFMDCIFKDNWDIGCIVFSDDGSALELLGGKITDNVIEEYAIHNKAENLTISKITFKDNTSKSTQYSQDILNEGNLILHSPKFKTDTYSVLNKNHIDVKKLSHSETMRIIENTSTGIVDEFDIPDEYKHDFSYLNSLIQESTDGIVSLENDIVLENYELDFFEGGIDITEDNITIEGNNHIIDAKNRTRIFQILGKNITIKKIIFKNGYASNKYGEHINGGGAIKTIKNSTLTLEDCQFIENTSDNDGGAIQNNGTIHSKNNKYANNQSKYYGGAIHNNNTLETTNDTYQQNQAKIAGAIYNNKKITIQKKINLQNNESDFKQAIYNTCTINMENTEINPEKIIYNTGDINKAETTDWKSFKYLTDELKKSNHIILQNDIKIEYKDMKWDEISISDDIVIDGNNHVIDLNYLNLNFIVKSKVTFKNLIFKNAYVHKKSLFEVINNLIFEDVKFINNKFATGCYLINNINENNKFFNYDTKSKVINLNTKINNKLNTKINNKLNTKINDINANNIWGLVEIVDSGFYNNSSKNKSLINNNGELIIINTNFTNNNSQSEGTIINNMAGNEKQVLVKNSNFTNNSSTKNGGAIICREGTIFEIKDSRFVNNNSNLKGGAIYSDGDEFKLHDCIFNGNHAFSVGGAIYNHGKLSCKNTDFTNNSAQNHGGAIATVDKDAVKLKGCNFKDNNPTDIYSFSIF